MALKSSFEKSVCFFWKINFTSNYMQLNRLESDTLDFMNSKWNLSIATHFNAGYIFNLYLVNEDGENPRQPFQIRTYLEYDVFGNSILCSKINVSTGFETLYRKKYDVIKQKLNIADNGMLLITCVISPFTAEFLDLTTAGGSTDDASTKLSELSLKPMVHLQTLSADMGDMLHRNIMTDVRLKCGGEIIPAHKAVLASRSKVFSSMFQNEMFVALIFQFCSNTVDLTDIEPSTLREFLRYLYTGTIPEDLSAEIIAKLYETSDKYAVHTLQEECAQILAKKLNEENFIQFLMLSEEHSDPKLKDAVANFIIEHPTLFTTDIWVKFSDEFSKIANEIYKKYTKHTLSK